MITTCNIFLLLPSIAEVAQLVEHYLAKVDVASSSLVFRDARRGLEGLQGAFSCCC